MSKTSSDEFYMLIDDSNNRPLTEQEKKHKKFIENQPGYKERLAQAEKKINKELGIQSSGDPM